ncbi:jeltraxin-like [Hyla sarda]|uniref:jeltraxin-like n=1 Tax=Hyla sarda TaxID=327740 RepID=UPI0024C30986|nr:jeltraxin-like [Hyla sarda]XP_056402508.1 jeltraxin-like [Hyla sarda]XP_056402509.1 jeltraxin-like [Hyla sarda]XP_056402510.1 jeltraxin-like [Hyla sarda]XP_056402511.1 jeltraxin-like [Hyla sarda]XP_056402513.1 jeltraxin-like [Hyla sarda]
MRLIVLLFLIFCGCFSQEDIGRNIILFPRQTSTDHVILKPIGEKLLEQLTVCLRSYTELIRVHSLFSLATPGKDNAFLIFQEAPNLCSVHINQEEIAFKVDPGVLDWKHTCVTWDSVTGLLQLWINGKRYPRRVTTSRSPIGPQMSIILGQEQDNLGGGFDAGQSFLGEICDVNMWDYVLPPEAITQYFYFNHNVNMKNSGWINGTYISKGNVIVLKNEFCSFYST